MGADPRKRGSAVRFGIAIKCCSPGGNIFSKGHGIIRMERLVPPIQVRILPSIFAILFSILTYMNINTT
jgi:hypothetical protein